MYAGFVLPKGYPDTVTPDYLPFQLWAVPAHITGWVGTSLATSSLLKSVGVANSAAGTAAATSAIKWITKDGIGAAGRSLVRRYQLSVPGFCEPECLTAGYHPTVIQAPSQKDCLWSAAQHLSLRGTSC